MEGLGENETLYRWFSLRHCGPDGLPNSFAFKPRNDETGLSFWRGDELNLLNANRNTGVAAIRLEDIQAAYSAEGVELKCDVGEDGHVLIEVVPGKPGYRVARVLALKCRVIRQAPV